MLSSWGVDFDAVNVPGNAEAQATLERLGIPRVPATVVRDKAVHGWNPEALAGLVGVPFTAPPRLEPSELALILDRILAYAQHGLSIAPDTVMKVMKAGRKRTLRELAYHLFRISLGFVEAMESGRLPLNIITDYGPPSVRTGGEVAAYGDTVRSQLRAWFASAPPEVFARTVDTYYGAQGAHELLERTVWHAGQHLRQVYDLLEERGVLPQGTLDDTVFEGLPMPLEIW